MLHVSLIPSTFKRRSYLFFKLFTLKIKINCFGAFKMPCHHWDPLCHILAESNLPSGDRTCNHPVMAPTFDL